MGEKWSEKKKKRVQEFLGLCFFLKLKKIKSKKFLDSKSSKTVSALDTPYCNFLELGFWILTNRGLRHPVLVLPYPNSIQVLGMEQPNAHKGFVKSVKIVITLLPTYLTTYLPTYLPNYTPAYLQYLQY